ncbi:hypothetical protein C493_07749 [Natronolimnohabitans innermongolicus JCM 12255]|uniref:Uncharacterized protein n=1 Tax=Natronolimnohabitans innermongolicus JCM 12255 TaxID=1227499 RepID=L9X8I8_9EURY|nr:hypothetical protein C493_07749 [Natronolimnohabitans innermongolicus JCM 12255]
MSRKSGLIVVFANPIDRQRRLTPFSATNVGAGFDHSQH